MFDDISFTLLAMLTLVFTYKFSMRVIGERQQNKQIFHQAFKLLPLENSLQTSWDHIEGYFSDRSYPCTLNYLESFYEGTSLVHRIKIEFLHQNHIAPGIQVRLFYPDIQQESSNPASRAFRQQLLERPPLCEISHDDWALTLPTELFYPKIFASPPIDALATPEEISIFSLVIDREQLVVTADFLTETSINQARQMAQLCNTLLELLPDITTTRELNTPYLLLHHLILDAQVLRGNPHLIPILDVLLDHDQSHPYTLATWSHLTQDRSLENLYFFFTYCPAHLVYMLSNEELLEFFHHMMISDLTIPDTHLLTLLPRLSLSLLCDSGISITWKLTMGRSITTCRRSQASRPFSGEGPTSNPRV